METPVETPDLDAPIFVKRFLRVRGFRRVMYALRTVRLAHHDVEGWPRWALA